MDKDRLKQLAERPEFIPGIYNYCDRWCERCPFTARCMSYAMSQEDFPDVPARDAAGPQLWDRMKETFEATLALLEDLADKAGIDLDETLVSEEDVFAQRDEEARSHVLAQASHLYAVRAEAWFEQAPHLFDERNREMAQQAELGVAPPAVEVAALQDALEVIQWYRTQIHVKLMRALRGSLGAPVADDDLPRDADGSAKVALLGIDRSITAWRTVWDHFPSQEDEVLPLLAHLERLGRETEAVFPAARAFVRPGFDEPAPGGADT